MKLLVLLALGTAMPGSAQNRFPPDSLKNITVLPAGLSPRDVVGVMQGYTRALGVRCPHCHVGQEGQPLTSFDFVSDEPRNKLVAREMIRMVRTINQQTLARIPDRPDSTLQVTCVTCHRGVARPVPLEQLMVQGVRRGGVDSAARAYRALRERYYGTDAYDFSERSLVRAATTLAQAREFDAALALLALDQEFYPRGSELMVATGDIQRARGDTTAAIRSYREALAREPGNQAARQRLNQLGQQP